MSGRQPLFSTDRERELYDSNQFLQRLIDTSPAVVIRGHVVASRSFVVTWISPNVATLFGYRPVAIVGIPDFWEEHVHPADRDRFVGDIEHAAAHRFSRVEKEYRFQCADGSYRWVHSITNPEYLPDGSIGALVGHVLDIHERKLAETALSEREAAFRALAENAPDGIVRFDRDMRLTYVNAAFERMNGTDRASRLGRTILDTASSLAGGKLMMDHVATAFETGLESTLELDVGTPTGMITVESRIVPELEPDGTVAHVLCVSRDITARKQAEEALRQSEERFRTIVEHATDIVTILGADGTIRFESPVITPILGWVPEDLVGRNAFELVHPDDLEAVLDEFRMVLQAPVRTGRVQFRFQRVDGSWCDLEAIGCNLLHDQAVGGVLVLSRDVSERRIAAERLAESERRYRRLVEQIPALILIAGVGLDAPAEYVSPRSREMFGYTPEEWRSNPRFWIEHVYHEDRDRVLEAVNRSLVTLDRFFAEYRFVCADGSLRWVRDEALMVRDADGTPRLWHGLLLDVTDEVRYRAEIDSQQRLLDAVAEVVIVTDLQGTITFWNRAATEIYGWTEVEAIGRSIVELVVPEQARDQTLTLMSLLEQGESWSGSLPVIRRDGQPRVVRVTLSPVRDPVTGAVIAAIGVGDDVTEQLRQEAELHQTKIEAEQASRAKTEFLSRMSHELRTPLNAILGFAQVLEMDVTTPEQAESVQYILRAGTHLLEVVNEVLDLSRIEMGRLTLSIEPVLLSDVLDEVATLISPLAAAREILVTLEPAGEPTPFVQADQQRLKQVVLNIAANAVKYNRHGGRMTLSWEVVADRVLVHVSDTGLGIAPENLQKVFAAFERIGAEQTEVEGTGLGLALARRLTEAMGGRISVSSVVGEGSVFTVELPLSAGPVTLDMEAAAPDTGATTVSGPPRTILYVEDNLSNLRLIQRLLVDRPGYTLLVAMQGRLGIDLAAQHLPDLVLLDLNLPDIDGEDVLRELLTNPATTNIPVVVLSADATPRQVDRLMTLGAHAYLTKPIRVPQFFATIDELLQGDAPDGDA